MRFRNLYNVQGGLYSLNTLSIIIHAQVFSFVTWQLLKVYFSLIRNFDHAIWLIQWTCITKELLSMFSRLYDCMNLRVSADWQFAFPYIKFAWELTFSIPVFPVISADKLLSLSIPTYFTILCDFNIANTMSNSLAVFIFLHLDQK
jgi:hypothetical protein